MQCGRVGSRLLSKIRELHDESHEALFFVFDTLTLWHRKLKKTKKHCPLYRNIIIWIFQYQTTDNYHYLPPANLLIISTRIILTLHYPYLVMMDFYITFATYFYRGFFESVRKCDFTVVLRHSWQRLSMVLEYIQGKGYIPSASWNCKGSETLQW